MKAIVITEFDENFKYLEIQDVSEPKPEKNEVLVEVETSSLSQADSLILRNSYIKALQPPTVAGLFGIGNVVECGGGVMGKFLKGKRVFFEANIKKGGTWTKYAVAKADMCFPVGDIAAQDGLSIGNILTAIGMLDVAKKIGAKSVVMNAAAGSLGRFVNLYFPQQKMNVISIIRSQKQREILENLGAKYILNQSDEDFENRLSQLSEKLGANVAFDSVGSFLPGLLMRNLPKFSTIFSLGNLSGQNVVIDPTQDLMVKMQKFQPFVIPEWLDQQSLPKRLLILTKARKLADSMGEKNSLRCVVSLEEAAEQLKNLFTNTTEGVVLIDPKK